MKIFNNLTIFFLAPFFTFHLYAQNQSPVISNIKFAQRMDGSFIVDVNYDVNDAEGNSMTIMMKVSEDNGATWNYSCNNITGDVGAGITNGTNKHIVWDFGAEHPETFGDQFRVKIIADDGVVVMGIPCPGLATITDLRDGQVYKTVYIGIQCWLKENLKIGERIERRQDASNNGVIEKYCYNEDINNCNIYGGLYQWNETMQYSTNPQGICPNGWHIPSLSEFQTLMTAVGNDGNSLKAIGQGAGATNSSGFSALIAGNRGYWNYIGFYELLGSETTFWSSVEQNGNYSYYLYLNSSSSTVSLYGWRKWYGYSVRCLKD